MALFTTEINDIVSELNRQFDILEVNLIEFG